MRTEARPRHPDDRPRPAAVARAGFPGPPGRGRHTPAALRDTGELLSPRAGQRIEALAAALAGATSFVVWVVALLAVLHVLGVRLGPLLTGAGLLGVALGFGAQSLIRDFLAGVFILVEDQFGVGDWVDVGAATGSVEAVTLRATRIRSVDGTVWHVPNGQIQRAREHVTALVARAARRADCA
ncbi:MAG: mechanosensitive ion channel family protein [Solirubrobacteraceae bacterium]